MFIFNTDLLLIDVTWTQGILVAVSATIAILVFTAGTMGYFVSRSRIYESILLVFAAFALFRPDYFMNRIMPPYADVPPAELVQALEAAEPGAEMRITVQGPDFDTSEIKSTTLIVTADGTGGQQTVDAFGLLLLEEDGAVKLDEPMFGTPAAPSLESFDFYADEPVQIVSIQAPASQLPKELIFLPALLLVALIALLQRGRGREQEGVTV